ncbi:MAG: hypothetical protein UU47_C0010G0019 [candidate division TM6 bacterium GW2011_GWE2_41_16]|nr:MAG: hypothetical protein UU47_C0010G0019 [candidate division TM6 bacterium GW2011_GWE2_41_16]
MVPSSPKDSTAFKTILKKKLLECSHFRHKPIIFFATILTGGRTLNDPPRKSLCFERIDFGEEK